jgi:hypothetical protein
MKGLGRIAVAVLLTGLFQCGSPTGVLPPFETVVPPAKGDAATVTRVSVCYNSLTTTADQVRAIAADSCGSETTPRPLERDLTLTNCPILEPLRATFACQPAHETP